MIIDFHTHFYPENLAERAISLCKSLGVNPISNGTRDGLLAELDRAGIDYAVGLPLANKPENVTGINQWALEQHGGRIFMLGTVFPEMEKPGEHVHWLYENGFRGIKLHPEYQQFSYDDVALEPLWRTMIEHDMFLVTHAGGDIGFPPPYHSDPESLAAFHRRWPELTLILAHFGSWGMWDDVEKHLIGLPVYLDTSFLDGFVPDDKVVQMMRSHGIDRILFGSDSPWRDQKKDVDFINRLPLSPEEKNKIFWDNARRLLSID
ncbi:MAG: amidohydrolase family protein [Victivallaceae bacterium]|jgi:predicted TIM-barrel fold metal-dependent hydrolase|nr:amidohydrolase family protein [Victivallaceae bacterium]